MREFTNDSFKCFMGLSLSTTAVLSLAELRSNDISGWLALECDMPVSLMINPINRTCSEVPCPLVLARV